EGARHGPSLMPGGSKEAWKIAKPLLEKIAAKHDVPCVEYIGKGGSGHFVKMVHNGIEYAVMQLLAEAYDLARSFSLVNEFVDQAKLWNQGRLEAFLVEVTEKVIAKRDKATDKPLIDFILDSAGQKGTGTWTASVALELGVATPTISAAVNARILSSRKTERVNLARNCKIKNSLEPSESFFEDLEASLYLSFLLSFDQGMTLLKAASEEFNWELDRASVASVWREGCILRSKILSDLMRIYKHDLAISCILFDEKILSEALLAMPMLKNVLKYSIDQSIPCLAFGACHSYIESLLTENLPQNLTQAQRDFFGSHTYQRKDKEGVFHTNWNEKD
ncbi:MAG: NADP-dependent phosphogluconate dehydrogenase, partial [Bdellovibrionales bacterium]|nr:NADP-dependent phosphogluconate dehydrogenase [Bdellovibrionales bacterium]